jgi:hypothetical protein
MWSIGGMVTEVFRERHLSQCHFVHHKSHTGLFPQWDVREEGPELWHGFQELWSTAFFGWQLNTYTSKQDHTNYGGHITNSDIWFSSELPPIVFHSILSQLFSILSEKKWDCHWTLQQHGLTSITCSATLNNLVQAVFETVRKESILP